MSDENETPAPDPEQPPGWLVLDPDGNVINSGPVTQLEAVSDTGPAVHEEEQEQ